MLVPKRYSFSDYSCRGYKKQDPAQEGYDSTIDSLIGTRKSVLISEI